MSIRINDPDIRLPVLAGDITLQPAPFRKLGSVGIERVAHAGDFAVLHAVRKQGRC